MLRIAIQKSGRLSEKSNALLKECGIQVENGNKKLKAQARNFPLEVMYLRDDDIPQYVADGVVDVGILGENGILEKEKAVEVIQPLGFAKCRLSLAVSKEVNYTGIQYFEGRKIATSYPKILKRHLDKLGVNAEVEEISGSVEIAPSIGLADGVFDIVSTGSTLMTNGLKEVETLMRSQAVMIATPNLSEERQLILEKLLFRIKAVKSADQNKYILLNAPNSAVEEICNILPGMKSPTILPLAREGWSSIHSVVKEDEFWEVIDNLQGYGAEGILVVPIEKMII
ncbi:ATP phosphoribosyltransferase [Xanthovirga aplysinae]|uniref:ATP phosphoribosyltransferase n=1 Tax=Xanthovirga aplysinae TaxID=2529853 RepID=UPI0012BCA5C0|nr:ATP phosphoribosyltransferase [Xanthovirga aplysinae]MTI32216.1 ATP phosphoribosyltransferase [Xanthovirga aplysinae]